jgi:hypothetical protein
MTVTTHRRRFAECFEFNRIMWRGTEEQRQAVVESLTPEYGGNHHRLLQRLDRQVNLGVSVDGTMFYRRSYLVISIRSGINVPGAASAAGFTLSGAMGRAGMWEVARHELGHVIDFWLLTEANRQWFQQVMGRQTWPGAWESWAEAVREWLDDGWTALTPILLPEDDT